MKSILKKAAGIAVAATLAFGMIGCSDPVVSAGPDYSKCVVGDFILKDGTILGKEETPESGTVAAVIVRAAEKGKPALGVGIVHEKNGLSWCKQYSDTNSTAVSGVSRNISDLVGDTTSGYMDGSNSWALLVDACEDLKNASKDTFETVAENYPAFNFCRKYGTDNGLTGELANGWYLPTVVELYTIYQNNDNDEVDESLLKAGGNQFNTSYYWSCCQNPSYDYYARGLKFNSGSMDYFTKYNTDYIYSGGFAVCAVRAFN